jgi:hypothetical protein
MKKDMLYKSDSSFLLPKKVACPEGQDYLAGAKKFNRAIVF